MKMLYVCMVVRHSGNNGLKLYRVAFCVFLSTDEGSSSEAAIKITQKRHAAAATV